MDLPNFPVISKISHGLHKHISLYSSYKLRLCEILVNAELKCEHHLNILIAILIHHRIIKGKNNLKQLSAFVHETLLASLTTKKTELKKLRDNILQNDGKRCKDLNPYLHSNWGALHGNSGCVCMDETVATPKSIIEALL